MNIVVIILMVVIGLGLMALLGYQVYALVKAIKDRKKNKLDNDKSRKENVE